MSKVEITPTQQRFRDVMALNEAGIPLTPEQLAHETGGETADFTGIYQVKASPELREMRARQERRLVRMAGMDISEEGPIGAAMMVRDVQRGITWITGLIQNLRNSNKTG